MPPPPCRPASPPPPRRRAPHRRRPRRRRAYFRVLGRAGAPAGGISGPAAAHRLVGGSRPRVDSAADVPPPPSPSPSQPAAAPSPSAPHRRRPRRRRACSGWWSALARRRAASRALRQRIDSWAARARVSTARRRVPGNSYINEVKGEGVSLSRGARSTGKLFHVRILITQKDNAAAFAASAVGSIDTWGRASRRLSTSGAAVVPPGRDPRHRHRRKNSTARVLRHDLNDACECMTGVGGHRGLSGSHRHAACRQARRRAAALAAALAPRPASPRPPRCRRAPPPPSPLAAAALTQGGVGRAGAPAGRHRGPSGSTSTRVWSRPRRGLRAPTCAPGGLERRPTTPWAPRPSRRPTRRRRGGRALSCGGPRVTPPGLGWWEAAGARRCASPRTQVGCRAVGARARTSEPPAARAPAPGYHLAAIDSSRGGTCGSEHAPPARWPWRWASSLPTALASARRGAGSSAGPRGLRLVLRLGARLVPGQGASSWQNSRGDIQGCALGRQAGREQARIAWSNVRAGWAGATSHDRHVGGSRPRVDKRG